MAYPLAALLRKLRTPVSPKRAFQVCWLAALIFFIALVRFPDSTSKTRGLSSLLLLLIWGGLIWMLWRQRVLRYAVLGATTLVLIFLILPGRAVDPEMLRRDYVAGLQRYKDVPYIWGGENYRGIDCSGLIRRGLIDSLFLQGLRTLNPAQVRGSIWLWWKDCTARALGEGQGTTHILDTPSINTLDHSSLLPGDLAVTASGLHVMAYLGDNVWIEADPGIGKVITLKATSRESYWLAAKMKIVRWSVLNPVPVR